MLATGAADAIGATGTVALFNSSEDMGSEAEGMVGGVDNVDDMR